MLLEAFFAGGRCPLHASQKSICQLTINRLFHNPSKPSPKVSSLLCICRATDTMIGIEDQHQAEYGECQRAMNYAFSIELLALGGSWIKSALSLYVNIAPRSRNCCLAADATT
jgi:hypothetical protein